MTQTNIMNEELTRRYYERVRGGYIYSWEVSVDLRAWTKEKEKEMKEKETLKSKDIKEQATESVSAYNKTVYLMKWLSSKSTWATSGTVSGTWWRHVQGRSVHYSDARTRDVDRPYITFNPFLTQKVKQRKFCVDRSYITTTVGGLLQKKTCFASPRWGWLTLGDFENQKP